MNRYHCRFLLFAVIFFFAAGCANIVPPTGGKKDKTPPKLVSVIPADSLRNTRLKRLDMRFDEYITLANPSVEVQISPLLAVPLTVTSLNKTVTVKIADTLLLDSTTYRISFGSAIQDLHEGNVFRGYVYTFSTGSFFDSLQLSGDVINAATGLPDTGVLITLYNAAKPDSAVVKEKPLYITRVDKGGHFSLKGLPDRSFSIYALKDANNNLIYDGGKEWIGFIDRKVRPGDTTQPPILLSIFPSKPDSASQKELQQSSEKQNVLRAKPNLNKAKLKELFNYTLNVDTTDIKKRTQEIIQPIEIKFNKKIAAYNAARMALTYDSDSIAIVTFINVTADTVHNALLVNASWKENTVYSLRLLKGFAKDTSGADAMPSRYTFRTKRDEDYGKLQINLPSAYLGRQYLLQVMRNTDTVSTAPIMDTVVKLNRLAPGKYTFRIIVDKNLNGKWDTGDLFAKIQPEEVIPYKETVNLKAGWENIIDFVQKEKYNGGTKTGKKPHFGK